MITFQTHVIRYFPYAMRSVGIIKKVVKQTVKPPQMTEALLNAIDEVRSTSFGCRPLRSS